MTNYIVKSGALVLMVTKSGEFWQHTDGYKAKRSFGFESDWLVDENARIPEGFEGKVFRHVFLGTVFVYDGQLIPTELSCAEWTRRQGLKILPAVYMR